MSATQLRAQQVKFGNGLTADGSNQLAVSLTTNGGLAFTSTTVGILLDTSPGLQLGSGGLSVKLNGSTLNLSSSGLKVSDGGIGSTQLGILTTKGDILGFSTVHARVPVGSDGQYLVADSSQALGIKWATFSGLSGTNFVIREVPSGTINGSNTAFVLANTPTAGTEEVYLNGLLQNVGAGNDYTISSATITYVTAPKTGDVLLVSYQK